MPGTYFFANMAASKEIRIKEVFQMSETRETLWDQTQPESEARIHEPTTAWQEKPLEAAAAAETTIPAESADPVKDAAPAAEAEAADRAAPAEEQAEAGTAAPAEKEAAAEAAEPAPEAPAEQAEPAEAAPAAEDAPGEEAPKPAREKDGWYRSESEPPIYADAHYEPAGATKKKPPQKGPGGGSALAPRWRCAWCAPCWAACWERA